MSDNGVNQLPPSIQGDGRKFISLLKSYLKTIAGELDDQIKKVESYFNVIADNPDTFDEQISNVTVEEKAVNGSVSLLIRWNSSQIKQYAGASIDVKVGDFHDTLEMFEEKDTVRHYDTTRTNQFTLDNVDIGKRYWIRIRGRDVRNALSISNKAPIALHYIAETKYVPKSPYEATVVFDKRAVYWSWKQYPQNDYEWTELRLDENPGALFNRLDLTTDWHSEAKPYARTGTAYLYNKGVGNSYSAPATIEYTKAVPHKPKHLTATPAVTGLYIEFDLIPEDCYGANVYINNEKHFVTDNKFSFNCSTGNYSIKVAYVDVFGDGELSDILTISTIGEIPVEMINKEKLGINAINQGIADINKAREEADKKIGTLTTSLTTLEGVVDAKITDVKNTTESRITATQNAINSMVQNNVNNLRTSITQVANSIDVKVSAGINKLTGKEIISRINLTPETVSIAGKYVHITGDTVFDNGVIVSKYIGDKAVVGTKIADGAITTDKLVANAITGDKIAANAITSDKIKTGEITAEKIAVGTITGDKLKADTITGNKIVSGSISGDKISANTIGGDKIKAGSVDTNNIKAGAIDAQKLNVDRLDAITSNVGDLIGGSITGGTFKNSTGTFKIDPDGNIVGANIIGSKISADTIFQAGYHLKNLDVQIYRVKHGEWCPIPEGFQEEECIFIPVGYIKMDEYKYDHSTGEFYKDIQTNTTRRISRYEFQVQARKYIGKCEIYMEQDTPQTHNIGINERRKAVVEWYQHYRYGKNSTDVDVYTYGELFILVFAKK